MSDNPDAVDPRLMELLQGLSRRLEAFHRSDGEAMARLEAGQTKLRVDFLDELGKTRADVMGKIAELKGEVSAIRDDIAVDLGSAEAAQRANDNTRAELRTLGEQVQVIWKQLKRAEADIRELKDSNNGK